MKYIPVRSGRALSSSTASWVESVGAAAIGAKECEPGRFDLSLSHTALLKPQTPPFPIDHPRNSSYREQVGVLRRVPRLRRRLCTSIPNNRRHGPPR
eukprot:3840016-Rhodomonas_salina.1